MPQHALLHAVHLPLHSPQQIAQALREARLRCDRAQAPALTLFFCDLPDASAAQRPGDAELIRCVQSGVMSMNARRPGAYLFLVRRRTRCAPLMTYLGEHQLPAVKDALNHLLSGDAHAPFEASNFRPTALAGAFDAVLITHACVRMPPDLPARMHKALLSSGKRALLGEIHLPLRREEPVFVRLLREDFSLHPQGVDKGGREPLAAVYAVGALADPFPVQRAQGCRFVLAHPPALTDLFSRALLSYLRTREIRCLFAPAQLAALLACALPGWSFPALAVLLLPELSSLLHPRKLPGALIRLCFLPRHALTALNALLCRRFCGSSIRVFFSVGSYSCVFFGLLTLILALRSISALAVLLPVCLLWLGAPVVERALSLPVRERIPLDEAEQQALRSLAVSAFHALPHEGRSPTHLLAVCAGCMLGELEADEAARRAQNMLAHLSPASAFDAACCLCAAQFFQEQMARCDAALRDLPRALNACASSCQQENNPGLLALLIRIAKENTPSNEAIAAIKAAAPASPMDALFLKTLPDDPQLFPITHPHTFLRLRKPGGHEKSDPPSQTEDANRFLVLACAALDTTFCPLFFRSAVIAPYAPLLDS